MRSLPSRHSNRIPNGNHAMQRPYLASIFNIEIDIDVVADSSEIFTMSHIWDQSRLPFVSRTRICRPSHTKTQHVKNVLRARPRHGSIVPHRVLRPSKREQNF